MISGAIGMIAGLKVISSPYLPRFKMLQFRFPKTKKRRIRKKWAKQDINFRQVKIKPSYLFNGNTLVVHPDDLESIQHNFDIPGNLR